LNQDPDGNARADDARLTPTNVRGTLNAGKRLAEIADDPLEHLRFFCTGEGSQELLNLVQRMHGPISLPWVKVTIVAPVYHPSALEGITTRWMPNQALHLTGAAYRLFAVPCLTSGPGG
jgi:hypothetical protein